MKTLVLGGARSGKSQIAEDLVGPGGCLYIATARPFQGTRFDADFQARIAAHAARRPATWDVDDTTPLIDALRHHMPTTALGAQDPSPTVLVDDLGTWVTHLLDHAGWDSPRGALDAEFAALTNAVASFPDDLVLVSPEVGMGVIPEHRAGRLFRDEIGTLNSMIAAVCDRVLLVVAGQALELKHV